MRSFSELLVVFVSLGPHQGLQFLKLSGNALGCAQIRGLFFVSWGIGAIVSALGRDAMGVLQSGAVFVSVGPSRRPSFCR